MKSAFIILAAVIGHSIAAPAAPNAEVERFCTGQGNDALAACLNNGGDNTKCRTEASAARTQCLEQRKPIAASEAAPAPPEATFTPNPAVEEFCTGQGNDALAACLKNGGDNTKCRTEASAARTQCLEQRKPIDGSKAAPAPPEATFRPNPEVEEFCTGEGNDALAACLKSGGDNDKCRTEASAARTKCLEQRKPITEDEAC